MQFLTTGHRPPTTGNRHLRLDGRAVPTPFQLAANAQPCLRQHPCAAPAVRITNLESRITAIPALPWAGGLPPQRPPVCRRACAIPACRQRRRARCRRACESPANRASGRPATASAVPGHWILTTGHRPPTTGHRQLPSRNPVPPSPARVSETCYTARSSTNATRLHPNAPHHSSARPPCPGRPPCRPAPNRTSELWPLRTSPRALSIRICNAPTRHPPRPPSTVESRPPCRPCPCRRRHPARYPVTRSTQLPLFRALSAPERHHLRTFCPKPSGI